MVRGGEGRSGSISLRIIILTVSARSDSAKSRDGTSVLGCGQSRGPTGTLTHFVGMRKGARAHWRADCERAVAEVL
jgi:hypothetical protein